MRPCTSLANAPSSLVQLSKCGTASCHLSTTGISAAASEMCNQGTADSCEPATAFLLRGWLESPTVHAAQIHKLKVPGGHVPQHLMVDDAEAKVMMYLICYLPNNCSDNTFKALRSLLESCAIFCICMCSLACNKDIWGSHRRS